MKTPALILAALSLAVVFPASPLARDSVHASRGSITLPTYPWTAVKHPYFRGTDKVNIYPYPMLDFLSRDPTNRTYQTVVLENSYLRITFLPELGGKIHEVIDLRTGQPMFYVNHVIKPALIGQAGAWTSGGVEWNTGPQGHTVGCMQPVPVIILPREKDGSQSVAIGETERIYGTKWTVVVTLRPGRSFIEERIRIYNPTETIRPYYFWNCTAVPNTKGFRFIYPMTLGTDHGAERFFNWPIHEGKDLSQGTNYQDASSIFAWHCDQDFFGSYNDDLDRGVVAYANHHQLPGKKAWTWGWGSYGTMHQMDLTDDDGPYNEVQTGPLLTQGEVGRLDPCEAVEWQEWWYPVLLLGGFTYANRDVAVNASIENANLRLRMLGTGRWSPLDVRVFDGTNLLSEAQSELSPDKPTDVRSAVKRGQEPVWVELWAGARLVTHFDDNGVATLVPAESRAGRRLLARFRFPLELPLRKPPEKRSPTQTAAEFAQAGWHEFLLARFPDAESKFRTALEKDPNCVEAHTGLAYLKLDPDPAAAAQAAHAALQVSPADGRPRLALAVAEHRLGNPEAALDEAWKASLDPATAVPGRALVGKSLLARRQPRQAAAALAGAGPWESDPICRGRRALALLRIGDTDSAVALAQSNLEVDPLDGFSRCLLWLANAEGDPPRLENLLEAKSEPVLQLASQFADLEDYRLAVHVLSEFYLTRVAPEAREPSPGYWAWAMSQHERGTSGGFGAFAEAQSRPSVGVWPHLFGNLDVLWRSVGWYREDGRSALWLGHLLFHLGRHAEGRKMWQKAAELGAEPVIAYRALGMAAKTLDNDLQSARDWLEKASQADGQDAIVARDLANVLFALADQAGSDAERRELTTEARDRLRGAFEQGKGRSDFVALLARSHSRLGETTETARLLDSVRITIWEGAHEAHDLFEEAHLALGDAHLKAGRPAEALAEFNRALEYPKNLATGRLENTCDAHIHFRRGQALAALGHKDEARAAWRQALAEPASKDPKKEKAREQAREALLQTPK